jgi:hypothetical protein
MKNNYRSIIIQILLMFSIMLAILAVFLKYVILDKNTYLNILNEKGAYEQTKDYLYVKIDNMLSSKNINIDIKESIITEDDIKNEADNLISGFIQYLETGKNNIKPIDVELYKQRVKDIIGKVIKPTNNELSFNSNLQIQNTAGQVNKLEYSNMMVYKEQSKVGQSSIKVQRLMTQSEAEAKVRELLKQKGLTEEQAIEKATKKGITEEQALKILAGYGITIDEEPNLGGNKSVTESSDKINGSTNSSKKDSNNTTGNSSEEASSNSQVETAANNNPADKSIKNKLDGILNKLLDEAGSSIEKEIEKMNLNKILQSSKLEKLAQITSVIYKFFWMFMVLPFILMAILIKINGKNLNSSLKYIRNAFLLAGLILLAIFFGAYVLKVYEKINIDIVYIKDIISYTIKHFLIVLSTYGLIAFIIGLFMFIPKIKKQSKQN